MSRTNINELSACFATCECLDEQKQPFAPAILRYKVDDVSNGINVVPYTTIPGAASIAKVTISSAQNAMNAASELQETRRVTFEVTAPGGNVAYPYQDYDIVRTNPQ
jgi:hypothetical protein